MDRLSMTKEKRNKKFCYGCGKTSQDELQICARCKLVSYCSRECQKKDWKQHRLECKKFHGIKKDVKEMERAVRAKTGNSKRQVREMYEKNLNGVFELKGFDVALTNIAHMVTVGGHLAEYTGFHEPSHAMFRVSTTAFEVFSKSRFPAISKTVVVTVFPYDYLELLVPGHVASQLRAQGKKQGPMDMESCGCIWMGQPDKWGKGIRGKNQNINSINFYPYPGSAKSMPPGVNVKERRIQNLMRIGQITNANKSEDIALNGTGLIPSDLVKETLAHPPNWEALANSESFNEIVSENIFGIINSKFKDPTNRNSKGVVTLFVNVQRMEDFEKTYHEPKKSNETSEESNEGSEESNDGWERIFNPFYLLSDLIGLMFDLQIKILRYTLLALTIAVPMRFIDGPVYVVATISAILRDIKDRLAFLFDTIGLVFSLLFIVLKYGLLALVTVVPLRLIGIAMWLLVSIWKRIKKISLV
jgi:hypothetical protein